MSKRKTPPKRIYLEVWPEGSTHGDQVHFEKTGYGVDCFGSGETSRIYVYQRVPVSRRKGKRP